MLVVGNQRLTRRPGYAHQKETGGIRGSEMTIGVLTERRRRDRYIAWGVSPRYQASHHPEAPEGGDRLRLRHR